jgi:hypothetical protein
METVEKIFSHFGRSAERLIANAGKARIIIDEINALETLAKQLREFASRFQGAPVTVEETPKPNTVEGKPEATARTEESPDSVETKDEASVIDEPTENERKGNHGTF